jgi:hypothetical protein
VKTAIALLGRSPERGQVKTRLARSIGDDSALAAYRAMLFTGVSRAVATGLDTYLYATAPEHADIRRLASAFDVQPEQQPEGDLGERMASVFRQLHRHYHRVLLVGTDCPWLRSGHYWQALGALSAADVVLQAAVDGGYVLIGSADAGIWAQQQPFAGVRFGTGMARQDTLDVLARRGCRVACPGRSGDVDTVDDLRAWQAREGGQIEQAGKFWERSHDD